MGYCFYVRSSVTWVFLLWGGGVPQSFERFWVRGVLSSAFEGLRSAAHFSELSSAVECWIFLGIYSRYRAVKSEGYIWFTRDGGCALQAPPHPKGYKPLHVSSES